LTASPAAHHLLPLLSPPPPSSTLFPYTTLFRSARLEETAKLAWPKAKLLILSFPHNPTTMCVDRGFFEKVVAFAREGEDQELGRSEEHTSELQSRGHLVCRLLLEKKKKIKNQ